MAANEWLQRQHPALGGLGGGMLLDKTRAQLQAMSTHGALIHKALHGVLVALPVGPLGPIDGGVAACNARMFVEASKGRQCSQF